MADETPKTEEKPKNGLMMASKKAKAYLIGEITWKMILVVTLGIQAMVVHLDKMPSATISLAFIALQTTIVMVAGFLEVSYIGKQGDLDKFLGLAKIASKSAMAVKPDGTLGKPGDSGEK